MAQGPFGFVYEEVVLAKPAADATRDDTVHVVRRAGTVTAVTYVGDAAIVGVDTHTMRHDLINKGLTGGDTRVVATKTYPNGVTTVAYDETPLTVTTTAANIAVVAGDVLALSNVKVGTNVAVTTPRMVVRITINPDS
jgi:hypothetical protein